MLARYRIIRGKRPPGEPLPDGIRIDTRKHTQHILAPNANSVLRYLDDPNDEAFQHFAGQYRALLEQRFAAERERFDALAEAARRGDVYIGCNCPTKKNPNVEHCHTVLALSFMREKYRGLRVVLPK
jgi:uncharacterized protein YeaO (DUF488 family)